MFERKKNNTGISAQVKKCSVFVTWWNKLAMDCRQDTEDVYVEYWNINKCRSQVKNNNNNNNDDVNDRLKYYPSTSMLHLSFSLLSFDNFHFAHWQNIIQLVAKITTTNGRQQLGQVLVEILATVIQCHKITSFFVKSRDKKKQWPPIRIMEKRIQKMLSQTMPEVFFYSISHWNNRKIGIWILNKIMQKNDQSKYPFPFFFEVF